MGEVKRIRDIGEKEIIRSILKPLLNPTNDPDLIGDDCAVIKLSASQAICVSTDRVPADLISYRLGLLDSFLLGYYLAVLNLSDIAAMGAEPLGLLLNLGLEPTFLLEDFKQLVLGAHKACEDYGCRILGGDLSSASELSISATSLGVSSYGRLLRRTGAQSGDRIFCTDLLGLTSTAFHYFLKAKQADLHLTSGEEDLLANQFRKPRARFRISQRLSHTGLRITCMDNTDGIGQTLLELSEINALAFALDRADLPIHELAWKVASYLHLDLLEVVLGPGADFQLLGTIPAGSEAAVQNVAPELHLIGSTAPGTDLLVRDANGIHRHVVKGWDYFHREAIDSTA